MDTFGASARIDAAGAHWTALEIEQQPAIWGQIVTAAAAEADRLDEFLGPLLKNPSLRIILTGAGTSAHIGECLAPALVRATGRRVEAIATTDLVASPRSYLYPDTPTLLVSFGRSGNSPESIAAVEVADKCLQHCSHLIFTCDPQGALYKRAQHSSDSYAVLLPEGSNDRSFAMTSSFTGMLLAAALALGAVAVVERTAKLAELTRHILPGHMPLLQNLVSSNFERVVFLGSHEFKGLARESALKMLELTDGKVVSIADTSLGFRHGPKTIVNRKTLVVVYVCGDDYTRQYDLDIVRELRVDAIAARVIALHPRPAGPQTADDIVLQSAAGTASLTDLELCLPYAVFAQSLALLRSLSVGVTPDNPNAAGTVSRVVKGVSIHPWRGA